MDLSEENFKSLKVKAKATEGCVLEIRSDSHVGQLLTIIKITDIHNVGDV